jgi:hypothetical protein
VGLLAYCNAGYSSTKHIHDVKTFQGNVRNQATGLCLLVLFIIVVRTNDPLIKVMIKGANRVQ